jgi:hypothetical protein
MTDLRQAAQQALEALESGLAFDAHSTVLQNLREALEQPEQEPVGWEHHEYRPYGAPGEIRIHAILASQYMMPDGSVGSSFQWLVDEYKKDKNTIKLIPLYTTPPLAQRPWVGLEAEEILDLFDRNNVYGSKWIEFARTVEAKLKEKNT